MRSSSGPLPAYQGLTLVVTAFMPDAEGALSHVVVMDTTTIEVVEIRYTVVPGA